MMKSNVHAGRMRKVWRKLFPALLLPILFLLATGASPIAFARELRHSSWDPTDPCGTGTMQSAIQITSGTFGDPVPIPITSISIDPCTLSYLVQHGDPTTVSVQSDGSVPDWFAANIAKVIASHAQDMWNKDLSCPHPENGVFFNIMTPTLSTFFVFPTTSLIDSWEFLSPTTECSP